MNRLITGKHNAQNGTYVPILTDKIDDDTANRIVAHFAGKPPVEGFYRHQLEVSDGVREFFSICVDIIGFINANHQTNPSNGENDCTKTTSPKEV
jgi:hypothetical protein